MECLLNQAVLYSSGLSWEHRNASEKAMGTLGRPTRIRVKEEPGNTEIKVLQQAESSATDSSRKPLNRQHNRSTNHWTIMSLKQFRKY